MIFKTIKKFLPKGIYGRAALILIVPIVTIQLVVSIAFLQRHFEKVTKQMTESVLLEVTLMVTRVEAAPDLATARASLGELGAALELFIDLPAQDAPQNSRAFYDLSGKEVIRVLSEGLPQLQAIDLSEKNLVMLWVGTRHGTLQLSFDRRRVSATNPHQMLVLMVFTGLLMTAIAIIFLRNQLRPIKRLALAAEAFGKGRVRPYSPSGATEVRAAGAAFLNMRDRIERQIEQRTMMLSGVSHDLRTPLTRFKLSLSLLPPNPEIAAMARDVDEMQRLLDGFLDFARDEASDGEPVLADPHELVKAVAENARRMGQKLSLGKMSGQGRVMLRTLAVERALSNLINNAVRYGTKAQISVRISEQSVRIIVEDDGPGIPEERRKEALLPFVRLDGARNQDRGSGVGLGLAIAADVARSHGGKLILGESAALGGLSAELVLAR